MMRLVCSEENESVERTNIIAAGYSALDEIHQSFVASRGASAWDSLLDSVSALVAVVVVYLFYRLRRPAESRISGCNGPFN